MTRTIPTLIGCLLAFSPPAAAAGPGTWSEDGSSEAATLRSDAVMLQREEAGNAAGTRGAAYVKQSDGDAGFAATAADVAPPPLPAPDIDPGALQRRYDLERIAKRGRSYFIPGVVLTTVGSIFLLAGLIVVAKYPTPAMGGFVGASAAVSAVGWPLLVMGVRLRKHPERYLDKVRGSASVAPTGFSLRF